MQGLCNRTTNMRYLYFFLILGWMTCQSVFAQRIPTNAVIRPTGKTTYTVSVPKGSGFVGLSPHEKSDYVKVRIVNDSTDVNVTVKSSFYRYGKPYNRVAHDERITTVSLKRSKALVFNVVPDVLSDPSRLTLFVYFLDGTSFRYMTCREGYSLKYIKYRQTDGNRLGYFPVVLVYEDKDNSLSNKIASLYPKDKDGYLDAKYSDAILKMIENGMLTYYIVK